MGSAISGGTVTITGLPGGTVSGTTDGSGDFSTPSINSGDSGTLTVTYGGCSYTGTLTIASCGTLNLCWCKTTTTVAVAGPASGDVTLSLGGAVVHPGDVTPIGTVSVSGTTYTFTLCDISRCESYFAPPSSVLFQACSTDPGWVCACQSIPIACGTDGSTTLTMYYWPDCYHDIVSPPAGTAVSDWQCCVQSCVNPAQPTGYYPKTINVRFTSTFGDFGSDSGVWIPCPLVSDVVTIDPRTSQPCRTLTWDSGCRGANGNYVGCPSGKLNGLVAGDHQVFFNSTSVRVVTRCCFGSPSVDTNSSTSVTYNRWAKAGCVPTAGFQPCGLNDVPTIFTATPHSFAGITCSPVNYSTVLSDSVHGGVHDTDSLDLMEPACASTQIPTVVADTGDVGGGLGG